MSGKPTRAPRDRLEGHIEPKSVRFQNCSFPRSKARAFFGSAVPKLPSVPKTSKNQVLVARLAVSFPGASEPPAFNDTPGAQACLRASHRRPASRSAWGAFLQLGKQASGQPPVPTWQTCMPRSPFHRISCFDVSSWPSWWIDGHSNGGKPDVTSRTRPNCLERIAWIARRTVRQKKVEIQSCSGQSVWLTAPRPRSAPPPRGPCRTVSAASKSFPASKFTRLAWLADVQDFNHSVTRGSRRLRRFGLSVIKPFQRRLGSEDPRPRPVEARR